MAKYKESEIERFEAETKNKLALEEKEKEIESQARQLLEVQKSDEAVLQQYQRDLQELREQLSEEKQDARSELTKQMEKLFEKVKSTNKEIMEDSKKDFETYKKTFYEQLKREWTKLDQYEMNLIEVEAEKRKTLEEAEARLKKEKTKSEDERQHCLEDIEKEKRKLHELLEGHLQERETARKDYEQKEEEAEGLVEEFEKGVDMFLSQTRELEWMKYKLCTSEEGTEGGDVSDVVETIESLTKELETLESENEKNKEQLSTTKVELNEKARVLKSCEEKVEEGMAETEEVRRKLVDCQQHFGEELGDVVNAINQDRDAELEKIESDREMLLSKHLEQQMALEVLVNEGMEKVGHENKPKIKGIKERVVQLVRSGSPGLERNSLQSEIIGKKVQIHHQQMMLGEKEEERRTLSHYEKDEFHALSQEVQTERENEQNELKEKIQALQQLAEKQGQTTEIMADYFESESSGLMRAQRYLLKLDKQLATKIRERREIEEQLENVKRQIGLQAESSQEQSRDTLEKLQGKAKETDKEIGDMRKTLKKKADQYLARLR